MELVDNACSCTAKTRPSNSLVKSPFRSHNHCDLTPGGPQLEKTLYEISNLQDFKDFIAKFQDFKAKKLRDIWNKMLSIRRSTGTIASKNSRK